MNHEYNENEKKILSYVKDKVHKMNSFINVKDMQSLIDVEREFYESEVFKSSDLNNEASLFLKSCIRWLLYIEYYYENTEKKEVETESYKISIPTTFLRHNFHVLFNELKNRIASTGFVNLHGIQGACIEYEDVVDGHYMMLDDVFRNEDKLSCYFQQEIENLEKQLKEKEKE